MFKQKIDKVKKAVSMAILAVVPIWFGSNIAQTYTSVNDIKAVNAELKLRNDKLSSELIFANRLVEEANETIQTARKSANWHLESRYRQIRDNIVIPALREINLDTPLNINLLMITLHAETKADFVLSTVHGNDFGWWQINSITYRDVMRRYLKIDELKDLDSAVTAMASPSTPVDELGVPEITELMTNSKYSAAVSAVTYKMNGFYVTKDRRDTKELCRIWKDFYNTHLGMGTIEKCAKDFPEQVLL